MLRKDFLGRALRPNLVQTSPLRRVDPRVKMIIALCASLVVMLPLERLLVFLAGYLAFLAWGQLLPSAARQAWRLRWLLVLLFILDWWLVGLDLAVIITLRLILLAGVFSLLVATTTPRELGLALESLHLPYRYAFSLGLAFQSLSLLEEEWWMIQEAQLSRRAWSWKTGWRQALRRLGDLVSLTVPAIVLTTKRAWMITEAAYARGFDAPHRRPYHRLHLTARDWLILAAAVISIASLFLWR
ncbi:MAG: energy-coupling factor transporter transmembrane component T [Chloroflexota bacterium]